MSIKIFIPADYFYAKKPCHLYGQLQISEDNVVAYYIVDSSSCLEFTSTCKLRFLGSILFCDPLGVNIYQQQHDLMICFGYNNNSPHIYLAYIGIMPERLKQIKVFLFDRIVMRNLFVKDALAAPFQNGALESTQIACECDFLTLYRLVQPEATEKQHGPSLMERSLTSLVNIPSFLFKLFVENGIMRHTVIYKHHKEWQAINSKGVSFINIVLDRILGVILMLALFMLLSHPGDFLIQISHEIIDHLYSLLKVLEGSPIGLKLNIQLNNFFLDCFKYHIQLWSTFLDLIEPVVRQLFLMVGVLGCLGFTYQLALLADLISIVGLHAHCFYVYTRVLYNVEKRGLTVLWQVVRGKRYNVLKKRIESHNYMNGQLYLATIFFSAILFLFPTTLVYYIVFATLKFLTISTVTILDFFRGQLISFPIKTSLKWLNRSLFEMECLKVLDFPLDKQPALSQGILNIPITIFRIQI